MSPVEHFKTFCQKIYRKSGRLHDTKSMGWPELSEQRRDSESSGLLTSLYWQFKKSIDRWIGQTRGQVERALGRWEDGGRARRILNTILRQNTRPSVSYQINGGKEEAAWSERMARLENDSAQRLWNNDRRSSSVHNMTRIHDPNIYLSTIRFTWSVIYGTRGRAERTRARKTKRERERGRERETVGRLSYRRRNTVEHRTS